VCSLPTAAFGVCRRSSTRGTTNPAIDFKQRKRGLGFKGKSSQPPELIKTSQSKVLDFAARKVLESHIFFEIYRVHVGFTK
jgi:hypothetical protein